MEDNRILFLTQRMHLKSWRKMVRGILARQKKNLENVAPPKPHRTKGEKKTLFRSVVVAMLAELLILTILQWARERRNLEQERDGDLGPEDYFEGATRGGLRDDDEDEFRETMLLVLLCLVISVLLYVRTRIVDRLRRDQRPAQDQPEQRQANGGVFPPVGDPARNEWAILR